jgi:hypothetical protein
MLRRAPKWLGLLGVILLIAAVAYFYRTQTLVCANRGGGPGDSLTGPYCVSVSPSP